METRRLGPLNRQIFWIYAGYILGTNVAIGLLTMVFAVELVRGTALVAALTGFMFVYWGVRLGLQLFVIDKTAAPEGLLFRVGDRLLGGLFLFFTVTYGWAFARNVWIWL